MAADKSVKVGLDTAGFVVGAQKAKTSLEALKSSLKSFGGSTGGIDKISGMFDKLKTVGSASVGTNLAAGGMAIAQGAVALASAAAELVKDAVVAAASLTKAGAELAIKSTGAREGFEKVANTFLHSAQASHALYEGVTQAAIKAGVSVEQAMARSKQLLNAGFKFSQITPLIQLLAAADKVKEGAGDAIQAALTKVQASGKLDAKTIKSLAKEGVSTAAIYDELAKVLGKTRAEVERMAGAVKDGKNLGAVAQAAHTSVEAVAKAVEGGKKGLDELAKKAGLSVAQIKALLKSTGGTINADAAIKAIENALKKKLGGLGTSSSVDALINGIKIKFEHMFDSVDLSGVKKFLKGVLSLFDSAQGQALKGGITEFFSAIFNTIGNLLGGKRLGAAKSGIQGIADALKGAAKWINENQAKIKEFVSSAVLLGKEMIKIAGAIATVLAALAKFVVSLTSTQQKLQQTKDVGAAIVKGIVDGITGGAASIITALVSAVMAAVNAAKAALGIASPSKVFAGIGAQTSAGMAQGIAGGSKNVAAAAKASADGAAAAAASGGGSIFKGGGGSGGSGGGNKTVSMTANFTHSPNMNFPPGTTPAQAGQMTQASLQAGRAEFDSHFQDLMRSMAQGG